MAFKFSKSTRAHQSLPVYSLTNGTPQAKETALAQEQVPLLTAGTVQVENGDGDFGKIVLIVERRLILFHKEP